MTKFHSMSNLILFFFLSITISCSSALLKSNAKITVQQAPRPTPSNTSPQNNFFDVSQKNCTGQTCPFPYSYCTTSTNCHCNAGWANYQQATTGFVNPLPCQYEQKKQFVAFLLEVIFPFGVGHLYAKRTLNGILKLLFIIFTPCFMCCIAICCGVSLPEKVGPFFIMAIGALYGLGSAAWLIIDLIFFAINKYNDGNGVPLMEW